MIGKIAGQSCGVLGRAWPPAKSLLTWFSARRPPRGKTALSWRLTFAQIRPAKINLSLFGRLALPKVEDERGAF